MAAAAAPGAVFRAVAADDIRPRSASELGVVVVRRGSRARLDWQDWQGAPRRAPRFTALGADPQKSAKVMISATPGLDAALHGLSAK